MKWVCEWRELSSCPVSGTRERCRYVRCTRNPIAFINLPNTLEILCSHDKLSRYLVSKLNDGPALCWSVVSPISTTLPINSITRSQLFRRIRLRLLLQDAGVAVDFNSAAGPVRSNSSHESSFSHPDLFSIAGFDQSTADHSCSSTRPTSRAQFFN